MEPAEPPPATSAPPPATSADLSPSPAPASEVAAVPAPPPSAPAPPQQPQPSATTSPAPSQPSSSHFPSLQHPVSTTSQQPPQSQAVVSPVGPTLQAQQPQQRPPQQARALRPAQGSFSSHFPPHLPSPAASIAGPSSSLPSPASSLPPASGPLQRGGMAIGVPATLHHQRAQQQQYPSFGPSSAFNQTFNGLPRGPVSMANQAGAGVPVRQQVQTIQNVGIAHTTASMRPGSVPGNNQQRPGQPNLRSVSPSSSNSQLQKFPSHGLVRGPSMSSGSQLPSPSQNPQPVQQPWMSTPGRPINPTTMPTSSYRPPNRPQGLQQRPHQLQQQQQSIPTTLHQQQMSTSQQQQKLLQPSQQHQKQQQQLQQQQSLQTQQQQQVSLPTQALGKAQQSVQQPQQLPRPTSQKPLVSATLQQGAAQPCSTSPTAGTDAGETGNRILGKRSIHELVMQIDPSEKLDPEVEDILVDIAEDFVESITTFGCSLAKHRKSTTLEAKDILLHLERNWNMTIPGFSGDEIKCYKKPFTNDIHKERLSLIKKSMATTDAAHAKNSATGQATASSKSHAARAPLIGSPKLT